MEPVSSVASSQSVVQHRNECKRGAGISYKPKLVGIHALYLLQGALEDILNDKKTPLIFVFRFPWSLESVLLAWTSFLNQLNGCVLVMEPIP